MLSYGLCLYVIFDATYIVRSLHFSSCELHRASLERVQLLFFAVAASERPDCSQQFCVAHGCRLGDSH